jgi:hydroxymethylbilane synthase
MWRLSRGGSVRTKPWINRISPRASTTAQDLGQEMVARRNPFQAGVGCWPGDTGVSWRQAVRGASLAFRRVQTSEVPHGKGGSVGPAFSIGRARQRIAPSAETPFSSFIPYPSRPSRWIAKTVSMPTTIRLGTRSSPLARWQADWVAEQLRQLGTQVEMVLITTQGDVRSGPLGSFGGQGVFTKELQRALLDQQIDLAVHSLKDLPTDPIDALTLGAVPPRESPGDAFISNSVHCFRALPREARIGTGSPRRRAQLLHLRPDLRVEDIRGNVDTRLRKLDEGRYDALVLAEAGLHRLGRDARIAEILPRDAVLPAVGQGALGLEVRRHDSATLAAVAPLNDPATRAAVEAERALLAHLRAGCLAPVGAWARLVGDLLLLDAVVLSPNGRQRVHTQRQGEPEQASELGVEAANALLEKGAGELVQAAHAANDDAGHNAEQPPRTAD